MCEGRQKRQHTPARQTTAIIVTNQARGGVLAGTRPTPRRDMPQFNSSRMDMISVCLKKTILQQIDQIQQKLAQKATNRETQIEILEFNI